MSRKTKDKQQKIKPFAEKRYFRQFLYIFRLKIAQDKMPKKTILCIKRHQERNLVSFYIFIFKKHQKYPFIEQMVCVFLKKINFELCLTKWWI